jgi:heptose-I-phosphate ethanolaminephosphotransferase
MKLKTTLDYRPTPDLRDHRKKYDIIQGERPKNVVFIIGESLNKDHMSLYGYEKKTTPRLDSLRNVTSLFSFNNVKSSAIGTVPAFRYMMSSLRVSDSVEEWTNKDFLLDIIKSSGYNTMWISNQSSSGVHDNIVARFA